MLVTQQVVASLRASIALLKSLASRKEIVRDKRWEARVVGGLKLLTSATIDVEGRRNAFAGWNDIVQLLDLVAEVRIGDCSMDENFLFSIPNGVCSCEAKCIFNVSFRAVLPLYE